MMIKEFGGLILFMLTIVGLIYAGAYATDRYDCFTFGRATGIKTQYDFGCYAEVNGKWVPYKVVFANPISVEIKK